MNVIDMYLKSQQHNDHCLQLVFVFLEYEIIYLLVLCQSIVPGFKLCSIQIQCFDVNY